MKTVISASRRTDIPAYYLKWMIDMFKEGEIRVKNPLYPKNMSRIDLGPQAVSWIVFWSRNYHQFLKWHTFFSDYNLFFHFTILSHHPMLEKIHLPVKDAIRQMENLIHLFGPKRIIWRYDPIIIWQDGNQELSNYDPGEFTLLCREFAAQGIGQCFFSFVTPYAKVLRRMRNKRQNLRLTAQTHPRYTAILDEMKTISSMYGIDLFSCCNDALVSAGIQKGACINGKALNRLSGKKIVSEAKYAGRKDCSCTKAVDIGSYVDQPCRTGCIYCYANPLWK